MKMKCIYFKKRKMKVLLLLLFLNHFNYSKIFYLTINKYIFQDEAPFSIILIDLVFIFCIMNKNVK